MVTCPQCGYENDAAAMTCANCETDLQPIGENDPNEDETGEKLANTSKPKRSLDLTKRKVYENRGQKIIDFTIGFVGWIGFNSALWTVSSPLLFFLLQLFENNEILSLIVIILGFLIPFLLNIGLLIYFGITRRWIALGALAAFFVLVVVLPVLAMLALFILCSLVATATTY